MNTKVIVAILVIAAIGMAITPTILDPVFADKGGAANDNSDDNSLKSCEKKFSNKCVKQPL